MSRFSVWRRIPLRVQGVLFNSLPLFVVLITAAFAYFSNQQRERTELSLNRHFEMVEILTDLQTSLLAAAGGLHGYALTHDPAFLQPYQAARDLVPQRLARAQAILQTITKPTRRAERLARFTAVQTQVNDQLAALSAIPAAVGQPVENPQPANPGLPAQIIRDQPALEAVGQALGKLRTDEQQQLAKRLDDIRSYRQRDYLLIFLSVLIGLASRAVALYFFHRRVVRRVRQLTENMRSLRDGAQLVHEPSDHADDIGELERELARIGDFLAARRLGS